MAKRSNHIPRALWQVALVALAFLSGCAHLQTPPSAAHVIPEPALAKLRDAQIPEDALGGVVLRVSDGRVLWQQQATRAMQPASTIKVLTSIVALETLKPSYRPRTTLVTRAEQRGDTLRGDLALVGGGADELSIDALESMLRTLRAQGVRVIEGDLIVDREFFQPPRPYEGVLPFDEAPEFRYNVIPDALMLGSNLNQLAIASDDKAVRVVFGPLMDDVQFASEMTLVDKDCALWEDDWKIPRVEKRAGGGIVVALLGTFPKNCSIATEINIIDRTDYAERVTRAIWKSLGGQWGGRAREGIAPTRGPSAGVTAGAAANPTANPTANEPPVRTIATVDSRTLAEFNRDINKRSDNAMTRTAYLTLGALTAPVKDADANAPRIPTAQRADAVVRAWLREKGIDDAGLVIENGSGLSRKEMISPMTLAQVLRAAHASKWSNEFKMSLPIVGVDGAMRNRLKDTAANEIGRMKTGGLRNVTSVAGYLPNANGETLAVVLFLNHDNARGAKGRAVLDELMKGFVGQGQ